MSQTVKCYCKWFWIREDNLALRLSRPVPDAQGRTVYDWHSATGCRMGVEDDKCACGKFRLKHPLQMRMVNERPGQVVHSNIECYRLAHPVSTTEAA